jgi:hypothetical protein
VRATQVVVPAVVKPMAQWLRLVAPLETGVALLVA